MNLRSLGISAVVATGLMVGSVSAATMLAIGDFIVEGDLLAPGDTLSIEYEASEDLRVDDFLSIVGTAASGGGDIAKIEFGYSGSPVTDTLRHFAASEITISGSTASGASSLDGFVMAAGDTFSIDYVYDGSAGHDIAMGYSFTVSQVPVPAAGFLLLGGLGGLAALRRRKQKSKA